MPRKKKEKTDIEQKLEYIGLDLNKIPSVLKKVEPINYRATKIDMEYKYRQYRYIIAKDIEIIISPTHRLDTIQEKYEKASSLYSYLIPNSEENQIKHEIFLEMLNEVTIEDIEELEEEQKELNKKIPFKIKYKHNYIWQIYYSEVTDKYFMILSIQDSDYSAFFFVLKKIIEKKRTSKIFVPISNVEYSHQYLKKSEFEDLENYLWLFTQEWPIIYEVYDKNDNLSIDIVGETYIYEKIKSTYRIHLENKVEANKFYKLLKALFIIQSELSFYYKFETRISKKGSIDFEFNDETITYEELAHFVKNECISLMEKNQISSNKIIELQEKLKKLNQTSKELEYEYLSKEKQISTYLECKKTFFGKVKYFFKFSKKNKRKEENKIDILKQQSKANTNNFETSDIQLRIKENYTIEELCNIGKEYGKKQNEIKNLVMDINALKLKNKNLQKKIENATLYIEEIYKHKRSIFEFWKYSNKDEVEQLAEGEEETLNVIPIPKGFDYEEDLEKFGKDMDRIQRDKLSKSELNSLFITTTNVLETLNKVKNKEASLKDIESSLKALKEEKKKEKVIWGKEEFDIFGGIGKSTTKVVEIANKKLREVPKDKFAILDINNDSKQLGYKLMLESIIDDIEDALEKIQIDNELSIYKATKDEPLDARNLNLFNIDPQKEIDNIINCEEKNINLYRINLKKGTNAIAFSNIIYYENQNKTLPVGMDLSTQLLVDISKLDLQIKSENMFRKVIYEDANNELSKINVKTITVIEYDMI